MSPEQNTQYQELLTKAANARAAQKMYYHSRSIPGMAASVYTYENQMKKKLKALDDFVTSPGLLLPAGNPLLEKVKMLRRLQIHVADNLKKGNKDIVKTGELLILHAYFDNYILHETERIRTQQINAFKEIKNL
jgi:hypothetical protein